MYSVQDVVSLVRHMRAARGAVGSTVLALGMTSLLTDVSTEMVATILPIYFVGALSFSPLAFGFIDAIYQGAAAVVRLVGGFTADRSWRHKEVAAVGYGLSTVSKLGLLAVGSSVGGAGAVLAVDRAGKGLRTAPRDALIALTSAPETRATAFGVHRGLDTAGALLGPLLAVALLTLVPGTFDPIFIVSFFFGVAGLAVLLLFTRNVPRGPMSTPLRVGQALGTLRDRSFRRLALAAGALAFATISDAFVYLGLQRNFGVRDTIFPLLFVATAGAYMLAAVPVGAIADRVGALRVFVAGYVVLGVVYTSLFVTGGTAVLILYLALFGLYYAATDGVLMAVGSRLVGSEVTGSALALLLTVVSLAKAVSSVVFGLAWTRLGLESAAAIFLGLLGVAIVAAAAMLHPGGRTASG